MKNKIKIEQLPPHINNELVEQRATAEAVAQPFPLDLLPPVVRKYVREGADACGADPSIVALPTLVTLAACIGTTRKISPKPGWTAPAILWGAVVAPSGTLKSCGYDLLSNLLSCDEDRHHSEHAAAMKRFKATELRFEKELAQWKRGKSLDPPPSEPNRPTAQRFIVDDQTLESLVPLMQENPRGLFQLTDELRAFFSGMGAYSAAGKSSKDEARWLSVFDGRAFTVDRKTDRESIRVPMTAVSVSGTIQPKILENTFSANQIASGMLARLLLVMPEPRAKTWSDKVLSKKTHNAMREVICWLKDLEHQIDGDKPEPIVLRLSKQAVVRFAEFVKSHGVETLQHGDVLAAAWSKLEGYALRFALVDHLVRAACGEKGCQSSGPVLRKSIENGIELARWFASETERTYAALNFAKPDNEAVDARNRHLARLVEWLKSRGGSATEREIRRALRRYRDSGKNALLREECGMLVRDGRAFWDNGRRTSHIVLVSPDSLGDGDGSQNSSGKTKDPSPNTGSDSSSTAPQDGHKPRRIKKRKAPSGEAGQHSLEEGDVKSQSAIQSKVAKKTDLSKRRRIKKKARQNHKTVAGDKSKSGGQITSTV